MDIYFYLFIFVSKSLRKWFLALAGHTLIKSTSVRKKDAKKDRKGRVRQKNGTIDNQRSIQKIIKTTLTQKHGIGYQRDPKEDRNRSQKSSKINAKNGNGKDQEHHQKSCFSE